MKQLGSCDRTRTQAFLRRVYLYWFEWETWRRERCDAGYHDTIIIDIDANHYAVVCQHCFYYRVEETWGE